MNRPPKRCLFCERVGNMSEQHVFPDRLQRVVPRIGGNRQYGAQHLIRRRGKTIHENRDTKENQGSVGNSRVRRVCKPCNEGWLNDMEQDCFPVVEQLIGGQKHILSKDDQAKLSRLATSITMVGEWMPHSVPVATQEEREAFRQALEPPPNWYIFVGRNASDLVTPFRLCAGVRSAKEGIDGPVHFSSTTMAMGSLLLHVLMLCPEDFLDVDVYAEMLGLAAICPPTDWIAFPLMPALDTDGVLRVRSYARESYRAMIEG